MTNLNPHCEYVQFCEAERERFRRHDIAILFIPTFESWHAENYPHTEVREVVRAVHTPMPRRMEANMVSDALEYSCSTTGRHRGEDSADGKVRCMDCGTVLA